jgi:predicted nucleic acid-binding protein
MTTGLVIGASAMVAVLRSEPEGDEIAEILRNAKRAGSTLLAPSGLWLEMVNTLIRRHRWTSEAVMAALQTVDRYGIKEVDITRPMLLLTVDLTERFGLTTYDASYLAVAIGSDARLLTLDGDLAIAAGDRAVTLAGPPRLHETPAVYEHNVTWPRYKEASAYLAKLRAEAMAARSG